MSLSLITEIQTQLQLHHIQGWLLYDLHGSNPLAISILHIPSNILMTRRCFYWIPREGTPIKIVHRVEECHLDHLPGEKRVYLSWREMHKVLQKTLTGITQLAMEYSPYHAIPTLSKVDGGLIDLIRSFNITVVSSAPFLQPFTCVWSDDQYLLHKEAVHILDNAVQNAWKLIAHSLKRGKSISEYDVQQFILSEFEKAQCITEGMPICGVNKNAADPHYIPTFKGCEIIKKGDFILIDLWCKKDLPNAVFADITRVGVATSKPTSKQQKIFNLVRKAQQEGTDLIKQCYKNKQAIKGCEVDQRVRCTIEEGGYGPYFTHRTGHNIHVENHGPGTNLDSLETEDHRHLIPKTCFSIEPGIYLPEDFGIRLEYDLYIHENCVVEVTSPPQEALVTLLTS